MSSDAPATERLFVLRAALLGDAIGYPLNGLRDGHIRQLAGEVSGIVPDGNLQPEHPERFRLPGAHSVAGQALLAAVAAFAADPLGRSVVGAHGARLQELADPSLGSEPFGALRHPGRPLASALKRWREAYPWDGDDFTTARAGSKGAACAVTAIAAVALGRDPADEGVVGMARSTHGRPLALAAAYASGRMLDLTLRHGGAKPIHLVEQLIADTRRHEGQLATRFGRQWRNFEWEHGEAPLSAALEQLPSLLRERDERLASMSMTKGLDRFGPDCAVTHAAHGFAAVLVPWAIFQAFSAKSPAHGFDAIANGGGETALLGLLTGAFMAARFGRAAFPEEWFDRLKARALVDRLSNPPTVEWTADWLALERDVTAEEERERARLVKAAGPREPRPVSRAARPRPIAEQDPDSFAPPPEVWLRGLDANDPRDKRKLKEARARKRVDWKEDRRRTQRGGDSADDGGPEE